VSVALGVVLLAAGVALMAWSRRLGGREHPEDDVAPLTLAWFFVGCGLVAAGAVLVTAWYVSY
jgi:hypothetical protein